MPHDEATYRHSYSSLGVWESGFWERRVTAQFLQMHAGKIKWQNMVEGVCAVWCTGKVTNCAFYHSHS